MTVASQASAAERAATLEEQIRDVNRQLAEISTQEPASERDLQKLQSSREWAEHQREKLVGMRVGLEIDIARERLAKIVAEDNDSSVQWTQLTRDRDEADRRLKQIESQIQVLRNRSQELMHRRREAAAQLQRLDDPRHARERQQELDALKVRLFTLD